MTDTRTVPVPTSRPRLPKGIGSDFLLAIGPHARFDSDGNMPSSEGLSFLSIGASAPAVRAALGKVMHWTIWGKTIVVPVIGAAPVGATCVRNVEFLASAPAPSIFGWEKGGLYNVETVLALLEDVARRERAR